MSIEHEIGRMVKEVVRNEMGDMRHRVSALEARMAGPVGPTVPVGVGGVGSITSTPGQGVFHGITTTGSIGTSTPKPEPNREQEAMERLRKRTQGQDLRWRFDWYSGTLQVTTQGGEPDPADAILAGDEKGGG